MESAFRASFFFASKTTHKKTLHSSFLNKCFCQITSSFKQAEQRYQSLIFLYFYKHAKSLLMKGCSYRQFTSLELKIQKYFSNGFSKNSNIAIFFPK